MTATTPQCIALPLQGLFIAASKRYVISSDKTFDVQCVRYDVDAAAMINAEIVNYEVAIKNGKYIMSFETVADALLFINGEEVAL